MPSGTDKRPSPNPDQEHGEGNYKATRDYNQRTKRFIDSGKVEDAAQAARPRDQREEQELERAEEVGRSHAKGGAPKRPA